MKFEPYAAHVCYQTATNQHAVVYSLFIINAVSNLPICSKLNFVSDDLLNTRTASFKSRDCSSPLSPE